MTLLKWIMKWFVGLALFVFLLTLFTKNLDQSVQIKYYGLPQPITAQFWELVIFCVALGILVAAIGDFVAQLKWMAERRRMLKRDREFDSEVETLNAKMGTLESENQRLKKDLAKKTEEISALQKDASSPSADAGPDGPEPSQA